MLKTITWIGEQKLEVYCTNFVNFHVVLLLKIDIDSILFLILITKQVKIRILAFLLKFCFESTHLRHSINHVTIQQQWHIYIL